MKRVVDCSNGYEVSTFENHEEAKADGAKKGDLKGTTEGTERDVVKVSVALTSAVCMSLAHRACELSGVSSKTHALTMTSPFLMFRVRRFFGSLDLWIFVHAVAVRVSSPVVCMLT